MPNPLFKKLGLKDGQKVILKNIPENYFDLLIEVPDVEEVEVDELADFIHIFESDLLRLEIMYAKMVSQSKVNGMIWVSWPKKTSGVKTDLDYKAVKEVASKFGMVDVKISAIDDIWTACKYMYPKDKRG